MKNKYIILFCMIMLLTIGLLLLLHHAEPGTAPLPQESHANTSVTDNPVTYIEAPEADAPVSASQVRADLAMAMARPPATEDKIRALVEGQNVPFNFYGRVIDQDSNSLAGVKLKLSARHWSTTSTGSLRLEKSTDADGRFDVHGITGDVFDLEEVTRDGYELEPYSKHTYGAVGGSVSDPVIFKMWSTNIHEQLITGRKSFDIQPDGRPYGIDLAKGTLSESDEGDLKVWVKRPAQVTLGQRYNWSCGIEVTNGSLLIETNVNSSMYVAPVDGYTPSFKFDQPIGSGWGDTTGKKRFYLMLKNGQEYGRISIELLAYYNDRIPGLVRIEYAINPSGSRILR